MKHKNYLKILFIGFETLNGEALVTIYRLLDFLWKQQLNMILHCFTHLRDNVIREF